MELRLSPFTLTDWSMVPEIRYPGTNGHALWKTVELGDIRIRKVEYSAGYLADHWCDRGHILLVLDGQLISELKDGRRYELTPGMSYQVSNFGDPAHRSSTETGARLFIID